MRAWALLTALLTAPPVEASVGRVPANLRSTRLSPALSIGAASLAPAAGAPAALDLSGLGHMVFDVRFSRGGQGDVAASYLTAADLIERAEPATLGPVTIVADSTELNILSRLAGRPISDGDTLFDGHATVRTGKSLDSLPPADVYVRLAAPSPYLRGLRRQVKAAGVEGASRVPLSAKAVVYNQTVLGNTEHVPGLPAELSAGGLVMRHRAAGLGPDEAGVYADPVARRLRGSSRIEIREALIESLEPVGTPAARALLAKLRGEALRGAELGLAYGISLRRPGVDVQAQFRGYLSGLRRQAAESGGSYLIATPSAFKPEDLRWWREPRLWWSTSFVDPGKPLPARAEPGRLYILRTGILPHPAFVAMMAWSSPPPVLAGDGALSAAVGLGRPFALTQVPWSAYNARVMGWRLGSLASAERERLDRIFEKADLREAPALGAMTAPFEAVSRAIPTITETMLESVRAAKRVLDEGATLPELLHGLSDRVLKASITAQRAVLGDEGARRRLFAHLRTKSSPDRELLAAALVHAGARVWPRLARWERESWVHPILSRLVLWFMPFTPAPGLVPAFAR